MPIEKVVWTALPNHWTPQHRLRLSVHVSPRLMNDDGSATRRKLGEFPAFVNWPARLNTLRFRVEFQGGPTAKATPEAPADPALWGRLFPPGTPVRPHEFKDHAKRNLHVFPVRGVLGFVREAYGAVGAAGTTVPSLDEASGPLARFRPLQGLTTRITDSSSFYEELGRARQADKEDGRVVVENVADASLPADQQQAQNAFFQAYRFYYRPGSQRPDLPADHVEPSPEVPEFDFHQMVAQLADHPALLRRLGLVVDLVVELTEPLAQVAPTGIVRVVPQGKLPETPPTCPGTRYELDDRWFGARPQQTSRMARGLLRLNPDLYDLFQVDVDGAAMQVVGFASTLERLSDPDWRSEATPSEATVPALRSAGLALALTGRGDMLLEALKDRRNKNALIEAGSPVVLDAEDLVRGYRVDVFDRDAAGGARWFSLHQRIAAHSVKDPQGGEPVSIQVTDEGYVKGTSASGERADHPTPSDDLYLHETVFGWEGWSLSAPRPGKRIVEPGEGEGGSSIARHHPEAGNPLPLVTRVGVEPGTLPRLRIGHTYRLRARAVDLAGNSRPFSKDELESGHADTVSEAQAYLRFEPVPSPAVLRRHLDTEGESLEHLVIRSDAGMSAADYAASAEVTQALAEAGAPHAYAPDSQRHLASPKSSQQMAEQDGRFDAAFGGNPAQMTAALRQGLREEGTFLDPAIVDLNTGQKTVSQSTITLHPPGTALPANRGDGLPGGAYAFYPDASVLLPYLPDPLAVGVSLTGYDHTGVEVFHQVAAFPGAWPTLAPFRLRLSEGPLGIAFVAGVLEVRLPKAEMIRARLASVFPDGRLEHLAVWRWIPEPARTPALQDAARHGRHWMLTPFRLVTFTHAVQHPLAVPDMTQVTSARSPGSTFAQFRGPILNHARSTGRLDVFGEWTEDVDLVTDDEPRMRAFGTEVPRRAQAFGFDIGRGEDQAEVAAPRRAARHEFGDTKYRRIVYHSVATTRFREHLPRPIADDPARIQMVEATLGGDGQPKPALVHHVLSTARPAAPDVLYVLPTFRWERQDEGAQRLHVRRGKAVRVWLRRPWFSSGDGEQLAVVLEPGVRLPPGWGRLAVPLERTATELARRAPQVSLRSLAAARVAPASPGGSGAAGFVVAAAAIEAQVLATLQPPPPPEEVHRLLRPYVTAWGSDPVWKSRVPYQPPTLAAFPRHAGYAAGLTLEELPASVAVVVAAHEVYYDRARKLWYCDIEIDPGNTYFPFVRLALARYQPHSLPNAHLSRVIMTDFIQLAPDRTAEVALSAGTASVTVRGYAGRNVLADIAAAAFPIFAPGASPSGPNTTMRLALERRVPGIPGDLGWERVGKEITLAPAATAGFHVTWTGSLALPAGALEGGSHRLVLTEVETYLRDLIPGDPMVSTSPLDFVRERIVYADVFAL